MTVAGYLRQLRLELTARGVADSRILDEARDHLEDAVAEELGHGRRLDDAEREALARFGAPQIVAAGFPRGRGRMLDRLLASVSGLNIAATLWLSGSLLVLAPARANHARWFLAGAVILTHGSLTLAATAAEYPSERLRTTLAAGAAVLLALAAASAFQLLSEPHFEGFRLVLTPLLTLQGALTLVRVPIRSGPGVARRHRNL